MLSGTVDIPQPLKTAIHNFRLSKHRDITRALVVKINRVQLVMEQEDLYDDITIEELANELPANQPRFVLLARPITHSDGRKSCPIALVNWVPSTSEIGMMTLHATALLRFQNAADAIRLIEFRDPDSLTSAEIDDALLSF
ncbi:hypothetical protein JOM56_003308 [Amanita muscaria]|uniref:ADF-H domain-containing protein n=1 Tax=Amanita muscaria (strain Koide BX008) TaxID=946122 RepID=A0A0C2T2E6_AMAMK|nr:hypothetical protein M378DRAFT_721074 [Amanita muscaria Koide BX008]